MVQAGVACDLHHTSLRRQVSPEDHQSSRRLERILDRDDHVLPRRLLGLLDLLGDGPARGRELGSDYETGVEQSLAEWPAASGTVDVDGCVAASWLEVGDDRGTLAHAVEVVDVKGDPD